jgi:hypothetical protein
MMFRTVAYHTDGRLWPSSQCKLNIDGPGWPAAWRPAAQAAIATWNAAPGHRFTFAATPGAPDHLAAFDLTQWNGWLAMTYTQPQSANASLTSGQVLINLYYEWDPPHPTWPHSDSAGSYDLQSVLVHEFGHLLHLDDDATARYVMQPTIRPHTNRRALGVDDLAGISHLYPMLAEFEPAQLGARATAVIHGKVVASRYAVVSVRITPPEIFPELYFSVSRVKVYRAWKTDVPLQGDIDVLTLGAHTPDMSLHVPSEASVEPNEEVVLFLSRDHASKPALAKTWELNCLSPNHALPYYPPITSLSFSIIGGFQGKYSVYRRGELAYVWRPGLTPVTEGGVTLAELERQSIVGL